MAALTNTKYEAFCRHVASGKTKEIAYELAGYKPNRHNAATLGRREDTRKRIAELVDLAADTVKVASAMAAEEIAISKVQIVDELARLGFANMLDYMTIAEDGQPRFDWSKLTRDQAAAIVELTIEEFKDGKGEGARDVRRVKFKLADKRGALTDIARMLGYIIERHQHDHAAKPRPVSDTASWLEELLGKRPDSSLPKSLH